jgi:hypothetical protein
MGQQGTQIQEVETMHALSTENKMCDDKRKFLNKPSADGVCKHIKRETKRATVLHSYKCPYCHYWHIGHALGEGF